jgi:putative ABC transport system substrate-binding protein
MVLSLGASALTAPLLSFAQQSANPRIGFLYLGTRQSALDGGRYQAFVDGMRALGYVDGKNMIVESRFADGKPENMKVLIGELVALKPAVIVATGSVAYRLLQQATTTIPIVITVTADPVANGYAATMARPGGNLTGLSDSGADIVVKYLELMKAVVPKLTKVGVLVDPDNVAHPSQLMRIISAAQKGGIQVALAEAADEKQIAAGLSLLAKERAGAVIVLNDTYFFQQVPQIAAQALKHRLPSIFSQQEYAASGGLMSYGPYISDNFRRAATYVDKILRGAKPGDLPFEQPTRFYLLINRKTAAALGLTLPQDLMLRADKVIE